MVFWFSIKELLSAYNILADPVWSAALEEKQSGIMVYHLSVTIQDRFVFLLSLDKKVQARESFTNGIEGYSPSSSAATYNPYFDDFTFYKFPNNTLKYFTLYPHPHKSLLLQTVKSEEKNTTVFSLNRCLFF